ncbi:hypothetical protein RvY_11774 [Ramazzottius varieornatus]|uniref:Uncharacterized protein n=1 Tax=Ramazzottius varieornatus TaxID=947166 RepID=A0A1D1VH66_RAMVA|nr:hypothetical protein RvY_11774 [Ramazzottius varieornatus]
MQKSCWYSFSLSDKASVHETRILYYGLFRQLCEKLLWRNLFSFDVLSPLVFLCFSLCSLALRCIPSIGELDVDGYGSNGVCFFLACRCWMREGVGKDFLFGQKTLLFVLALNYRISNVHWFIA